MPRTTPADSGWGWAATVAGGPRRWKPGVVPYLAAEAVMDSAQSGQAGLRDLPGSVGARLQVPPGIPMHSP